MKKYNTIIIGAGAAGLMAAYSRSLNNSDVLILEKNKIAGKKVLITGRGRCNITNNGTITDLINNTTRNKEFLYSSFYTFDNHRLIELLNKNGLLTKVERGQRVFPVSDKAEDVVKTLIKLINGLQIKYNEEVVGIEKKRGEFIITTHNNIFSSSNLIIATGGITYPGTGSTGDGFKFAKQFGHKIIKPQGTLVPIISNLKKLYDVSGVSVKNAKISIFANRKKIDEQFGEFVFTHNGLSGPIILTLSDSIIDQTNNVELRCDFKPAVDFNELEERLLTDLASYPKQMIKTFITNYFPRSLGEFLLKSSGINLDTRLHQINRPQRHIILNMMKDFDLKYAGLSNGLQGIVTKGGVKTDEIDSSTMESKLIENLYFAGEMIDVSALTGGFNLQIAFSTGYLAGFSI